MIMILLWAIACLSSIKVGTGTTDVLFSPNGGATGTIVQEINKTKQEILVQAYFSTSYAIAKALIDAHKKGIKVEVVLDKSQRGEQYSAGVAVSN